jgi:hypothetical protein
MPFVVEEDLAWINGQSLLIHGSKNATADDPTLDSYFFPKVKPIMEKALASGERKNWPLITLYLDIKNDPREHLEAISNVLDKHEAWLTTAVKGSSITKQALLDLKPMMVLVEDKQNDIKQKFFYDDIPTGGKIRVFGSVTKPDANPGHKLSKEDAILAMAAVDPEQIETARADNYHRWWGVDWAYIEKGGETQAGDWTPAEEARLRKWVNYGHRLGYFMSFYCVDGYTDSENQGWDKDYRFASHDAALQRWKALIQAKADFISTDQYEDVAALIHNRP